MRLTLRTLLAYLDDRLAPGDAKEIGQKIARSPFATELEQRIKDVVRRRRLASESAMLRTIDANLIAEYLDDQLTPELVALIEKEILASDGSLAEVASSHQILGLLADPVEINQPLKDRLYRLGPDAKPSVEKSQTEAEAPDAWKPLEPQQTSSRLSPMLLLGAMVLGWLVLLATDSSLFRTPPEKPLAAVVPDSGQIPVVNDPNPDPPPIADADTNNNQTPVALTEQTAIETSDADSPIKQAVPDSTLPQMPSLPATDAQPSDMEANGVEAVVADPPSAPDLPGISMEDDHGMLLVYNDEQQEWQWAAQLIGDPMQHFKESVNAVAAPFRIRIRDTGGSWLLTINGNARFRFNQRNAFQLMEGRAILETVQPSDDPNAFRLVVGNSEINVGLPPKGDRLALQAQSVPAAMGGVDQELPLMIRVFSPETTALLQLGDQRQTLARNTVCEFAADATTLPPAMPVNMPKWVYDDTLPPPSSVVETHQQFAEKLLNANNLLDGVGQAVTDPNPSISTNAIHLLTLIRQDSKLLEIVMEGTESRTRKSAIAGLRRLLMDPQIRSNVEADLQTRLPTVEVRDVMRLMVGVTPTEAEDRQTSEWLLQMLESGRVSVRELAIENLSAITGETYYFAAEENKSRRDAARGRWQRHLNRNDGRIQPAGL